MLIMIMVFVTFPFSRLLFFQESLFSLFCISDNKLSKKARDFLLFFPWKQRQDEFLQSSKSFWLLFEVFFPSEWHQS